MVEVISCVLLIKTVYFLISGLDTEPVTNGQKLFKRNLSAILEVSLNYSTSSSLFNFDDERNLFPD